jgi:hypothetical protein
MIRCDLANDLIVIENRNQMVVFVLHNGTLSAHHRRLLLDLGMNHLPCKDYIRIGATSGAFAKAPDG